MKTSEILAFVGWLSVLVLAWMVVLERVPSNGVTWAMFAFFVLFSTVASLTATMPTKK